MQGGAFFPVAADEIATRIWTVELLRSEGSEETDGIYLKDIVQEARPPHAVDTKRARTLRLTLGAGLLSVENGTDKPTLGAAGGRCKGGSS